MSDQEEGLYSEDPVAILNALLSMSKRHDRGRIGFDHADLNSVSKAWERAVIAGLGNKDFLREREKFARFRDDLKNGMHETGQPGVTFLETRDWPHEQTLRRAIEYLQYADIRTIN